MTRRKPSVFVTRKLPDVVETRMMELFDAHLNVTDTPVSKEELMAAVSSYEVLVPTVTDNIDADIISAANSKLRLIANFGNGVDHIDLQAADEHEILVTNTPGVLTEDTADIAMALILSVPRRIFEGERIIRDRVWVGWSPNFMLGRRISGKRLGIVGMGRIGSAIARRARGFGLSVHYHNRNRVSEAIENELEATYWESLDQMLAHMDIVSVNCPHTPATFHLISKRRLQLLNQDSYIVNTARGEVLDQEALIQLLENGAIMGAGLDVYESEPNIDSRLLELDNVVLLPHMSSATLEGRIEMGERVIINIRTLVDGHKPPDRVISGTTI